MKRKLEFCTSFTLLYFAIAGEGLSAAQVASGMITESSPSSVAGELDEDDSFWRSPPIEIYDANIQILDKISGKVFRQKIKTGVPVSFGEIKINLKRCFKNSPEDNNEIYAFIEISELTTGKQSSRESKIIFSKWLFASSASINLFSHPVYDVRVEF